MENARVVGGYMMGKLKRMQDTYEIVGEVRGLGLCLGLEMVTDKQSRNPNFQGIAMVTQYCYENGLWLQTPVPVTDINDPLQQKFMEISGLQTLRFMPPITVTTEQVDEAMEILEAGIKIAEEKTAQAVAVAG
ncbi:MAG TPA: hypothetical protein DIT99_13340 [Candidatus Latescibacteria bacterium]|nr:hypothetical protein [Candidatus Latescibacterota bacterium]